MLIKKSLSKTSILKWKMKIWKITGLGQYCVKGKHVHCKYIQSKLKCSRSMYIRKSCIFGSGCSCIIGLEPNKLRVFLNQWKISDDDINDDKSIFQKQGL